MADLKFPLTLSCGHAANAGCGCRKPFKDRNGDSNIDRVQREFAGAWRSVLEGYGCDLPSGRRHGPCPICGGKDRFRFDDKEGRGSWICNQCGAGDGLGLLAKYIQKSVTETADELIGDTGRTEVSKRTFKVSKKEYEKIAFEEARKAAARMIDSALMTRHQYMDNKGLAGKWPTNSELMITKHGEFIQPGDHLLVPLFNKSGDLVNVQRIDSDGIKRPITGGELRGGVYHLIDGKTKIIGIVEGFATGVTINVASEIMVYVGLNTGNLAAVAAMAREKHPESIIVMFADNDEIDEHHGWRPGQHFAEEAAAPIGGIVALPPEPGDWDDYRQRHGVDATKAAMLCAIKMDMAAMRGGSNEKPKAEPDPHIADEIHSPETEIAKPIQQPEPAQLPIEAASMADNHEPDQGASVPEFFLFNPPPMPISAQAAPLIDEKKCSALEPNVDDVDLDRPPGLAGEIVSLMKAGAWRELSGAYFPMALQVLSMVGARAVGYNGAKLSLITITLAASASGKDRPIEVATELVGRVGIRVYGEIRSDKDMIKAIIDGKGHCAYNIDEAHRTLGAVTDKGNHNPHLSGIAPLIMNLATTKKLMLSKLHADEALDKHNAAIVRLEKQVEARRDKIKTKNVEEDKGEIANIKASIEKIEGMIDDHQEIIEMIENGFSRPAINIAATSTQAKLASIITLDMIESGLMGRCLISDCGIGRNRKKSSIMSDAELESWTTGIAAKLAIIKQVAEIPGTKFVMTKEAENWVADLDEWLEMDEQRNHVDLGSIYARGSERLASLSSILAIGNMKSYPDGDAFVIELEHVKYAWRAIRGSAASAGNWLKINLATDEDASISDKIEATKSSIINILGGKSGKDDDGWMYLSWVENQVKKRKSHRDIEKQLIGSGQNAMTNAIAALSSEGLIRINGKKIKLIHG